MFHHVYSITVFIIYKKYTYIYICVCVYCSKMSPEGTVIKQFWEPQLQKGFGVQSGFKFLCHLSDLCFPMTYQFLVILGE